MIDPEALVGQVVDGRYRLASFLGDGSFGWAFAAEEVLFDEVVGFHALKLVRPKGEDGRVAVMREIKTMAQLSHPRLIGYRASGAVSAGVLKGCIYLVMEMGEQSLAQRLKRPEPMTAGDTLEMALHVCEALAYLHGLGAVHRDVKPGNVFRVGDGWKLGDFGLVRGVEGSVVQGSGVKGTPLYLAPEVLEGKAGSASDIWALGVTVQECLTGKFPYTGSTEFELLTNIVSKTPEIPDNLPAPLGDFVRKSLERAREKRWGAADGLAFLRNPASVGGVVSPAGAFASSPPVYAVVESAPTPAHPTPSAATLPPGLRALGKNAQGYEEAKNEKDGTVLICIPAAAFTMGVGSEVHQVRLPAYWMARTTVTNAQYRRFVAATGHRSAGDWEEYARKWGGECPVVNVSWHDAVAYAKWADLRLPTETEWEYAARGLEGRQYPWGDEWDASKCCNSVGGDWGSAEKPLPVGSYPQGASPFGCLDLAGNVWEWCSSLYLAYPYRADDGRERAGARGGDQRVVRGGSWDLEDPDGFRGAYRLSNYPDGSYFIRGFRCVRPL